MSWSQRLNAWLGWCHKGLSSRYMCFGMKSGAVFNFFTKHHCHDQLHLSTQCWRLCFTSYSYDCEVPGKYYRAGFPKITYFRICYEQYSCSTDIDYFQHIVEVAKSFLVQNWRKKNLHYWLLIGSSENDLVFTSQKDSSRFTKSTVNQCSSWMWSAPLSAAAQLCPVTAWSAIFSPATDVYITWCW